MSTDAYWISPRGKLVSVGINHIDTIIKNPKKFGYSTPKIEKIYKKHKEKMGVEGDAREEIILDVVKSGWIRLRRYVNRYWSITINTLNNKTKDVLWQWSNEMLKKKKEKDKYMTVQIVPIGSGKIITKYDIEDISNDVLVSESYEDRCILEAANIEDLPDIGLKTFKDWDNGN